MAAATDFVLFKDLPASVMAAANVVQLAPQTDSDYQRMGYDYTAEVVDDDKYTTSSFYKLTVKEGAYYSFTSFSFFEPLIKIYDGNGKFMQTSDPLDRSYFTSTISRDSFGWNATFSGDIYIDPGWRKGSYYKDADMTINVDIDGSGLGHAPAPAPAPAPPPAAASVTLPAVLMAPAPHPEPTSPAANAVNGTDGADNLKGGSGMDLIAGGNGNDTVNAGLGNDFVRGGAGNDTLDGGAGIDTAQYAGAYTAYTVTVDPITNAIKVVHNAGGADGTDVTSNFEFYQFGDKLIPASQLALLNAPQIKGTDAAETLSGTGAADAIFAGKGDDAVVAGGGSDLIVAGKGQNSVNGGAGIDTLYVDTASANARITRQSAVATEVAVTSMETTSLNNVERLQFKDKYVVLDLEPGTSGNKAALLAYTLKGSAGLKDGDLLAKMLLPLFDGGFSVADVSSYLIDSGYVAGLTGDTSNAKFVATLFKAVVGSAPDSATAALFESLITSGAYTQASMLAGVAQLELVGTAANLPQYASGGLVLAL